jgi:ABC-2 type transport system permease protein
MVKSNSKRNVKRQSIFQLLLLTALLIIVNILSGFIFTRFDMTAEKRYSLSPSSKHLASSLDDIVYFKVYLEGDLPPGFKKLKNSIKEVLDEFRIYAGDNIEYEFIDPSANPDKKTRTELYKQITEKGLYPTSLEEADKSGQSQKIIFPGAIVNYRSNEFPLLFLKSRIGSSPEEMLNTSVENLEYEIASVLRKIKTENKARVGFLKGQNELNEYQLADIMKSLSEFYKVDSVIINNQLRALDGIKTLIIAGPDSAFDEKDKFITDQFIMNGGRVLWLINKMQMNMDSLSVTGTSLALANDLNIDDMLFKYGVRINADLIMDLQAAPIPIVTGYTGNQPKQENFLWYYFPLLSSESKHPVVNNLNLVKGEFVSSIDTIETDSSSKTVLLSSSRFSRLQLAPARVSLNILREDPDPRLYQKKFIPVAVLAEGKFVSNYLNRIPAQLATSPEINFRSRSSNTKMIVISDADIIANHVSRKGAIYPLGYDRITQQTYGNKNFILNCVDYLCDNTNVLELRAKEFRLRMLDRAKTVDSISYRWLNLLIPPFLIIIFGLIFSFIRRKKYVHN